MLSKSAVLACWFLAAATRAAAFTATPKRRHGAVAAGCVGDRNSASSLRNHCDDAPGSGSNQFLNGPPGSLSRSRSPFSPFTRFGGGGGNDGPNSNRPRESSGGSNTGGGGMLRYGSGPPKSPSSSSLSASNSLLGFRPSASAQTNHAAGPPSTSTYHTIDSPKSSAYASYLAQARSKSSDSAVNFIRLDERTSTAPKPIQKTQDRQGGRDEGPSNRPRSLLFAPPSQSSTDNHYSQSQQQLVQRPDSFPAKPQTQSIFDKYLARDDYSYDEGPGSAMMPPPPPYPQSLPQQPSQQQSSPKSKSGSGGGGGSSKRTGGLIGVKPPPIEMFPDFDPNKDVVPLQRPTGKILNFGRRTGVPSSAPSAPKSAAPFRSDRNIPDNTSASQSSGPPPYTTRRTGSSSPPPPQQQQQQQQQSRPPNSSSGGGWSSPIPDYPNPPGSSSSSTGGGAEQYKVDLMYPLNFDPDADVIVPLQRPSGKMLEYGRGVTDPSSVMRGDGRYSMPSEEEMRLPKYNPDMFPDKFDPEADVVPLQKPSGKILNFGRQKGAGTSTGGGTKRRTLGPPFPPTSSPTTDSSSSTPTSSSSNMAPPSAPQPPQQTPTTTEASAENAKDMLGKSFDPNADVVPLQKPTGQILGFSGGSKKKSGPANPSSPSTPSSPSSPPSSSSSSNSDYYTDNKINGSDEDEAPLQ